MIQSPDSEFENENDSQEEEIEIQENIIEALPEDKALVVSEDVFPDSLLIVPLYDRPLFPKMLLPVIISEEKLGKVLLKELKGPLRYVGLVYSYEPEDDSQTNEPGTTDNLSKVGAVGKIVQAAKHGNDPMHIIVQVMERFEIIDITSEDPIIRAKVEYITETGEEKSEDELKAFSVSIINLIKELVQLNPLFKEELGLLMGRINLKDPATLADFAASMTTASGKELQ
jgi:ATP-dependent Lon protease